MEDIMLPVLKPGQVIVCTKDLYGPTHVKQGDKAIYLGDSKIRMLDGPSEAWVFGLLITAPFELV